MRSVRSSQEERTSPVSAVPSDHPSALMEDEVEQIIPGCNEEEQQAAAHSPLNAAIPRIATENVRPLVVSFLTQAGTADVTRLESREILVEMFMEVISAISNLILDAFRNILLEESAQETRLTVSEESIRRAVCPSLFDSFRAALGHTHEFMNVLCKMISQQVTDHVNSILCRIQMKGKRLMVPEHSEYRPQKDKLKAMVCHARTMLRSVKDKVKQGCGGCIPTKHSSMAEHQEERAPISRKRRLRETLGRCSLCGSRSVQQKSADEAESDEEQEPSVQSMHTVEEEVERAPIRRKQRLREILGRCSPCGSYSVQQKFADEAESDEEQEPSVQSMHTAEEEVERAPISRKWRLRETLARCCLCGGLSEQQKYPDGEEREEEQSRARPLRARLAHLLKEVERILLAEALKLSGEEERNLRHECLQTASAIVNLISDEISHIASRGSPCLTRVSNKIKSFFALCFAKASLRSFLSCLCRSPSARPEVSLEEVMEATSPLLQELVQLEGDVYQALPSLITQGRFTELRNRLTDVIFTRIASVQNRLQFKRDVEMAVRNFMSNMCTWLHNQMQLPGLKNPVQRALERIQRLVFRIRRSNQLTLMEESVPLPSQPSQLPHVVPLKIPAEAPVSAPDVPRATSQRLDPLNKVWTKKDCNMLVYEVVSRIFQKNFNMMTPLSKELMTELCEEVLRWNVLVEPSVRSCKDVASAVYKDLCKGQKKTHVMHAAFAQSDFSSEVLDAIHRNLTAPQKKRRTLSSFLRSVCSAICRR